MLSFVAYALLLAGAVAQYQFPPENSQLALLNADLTCRVFNTKKYVFNAAFTATAPTSYGSGREIYLSDIAGAITVPPKLLDFVSAAKIKKVTADAEVCFSFTNASPEHLVAYRGTVNVPIPCPGQNTTIRLPAGNGTLSKIGPIRLGAANTTARVTLSEVSFRVHLKGVPFSIPITCGKQNVEAVFTSINVDATSGQPFAPTIDRVPDFPPTFEKQRSTTKRLLLDCYANEETNSTHEVELSMRANVPTALNPGQSFNLTQVNVWYQLTNASYDFLVDKVKGLLFPFIFGFNGAQLQLAWENASPATYDSRTVSVGIGLFPGGNRPWSSLIGLSTDADPYPNISWGPFVAGPAGSYATLTLNPLIYHLELWYNDGFPRVPFDVTCLPRDRIELTEIPITNSASANRTYGYSPSVGGTTLGAASKSICKRARA